MKVNYDEFAWTFSRSRVDHKWKEIEYFFSIGDHTSILDIGCGSGRLISLYKEYYQNTPSTYTGIDASKEMIAEAKKQHPDNDFRIVSMEDIDDTSLDQKYTSIFFIASFHHLDTYEKRLKVLKNIKNLLQDDGKIYMTNWALESSLNKNKYASSFIKNSEDEFGSKDFSIKIGKHSRYYHSFGLSELESLVLEANFEIIENRVFEGERNIITILRHRV